MQFIGFTRHKVLQTLCISLLILAFLKMDFYWDTPLAEKIRLVVFDGLPETKGSQKSMEIQNSQFTKMFTIMMTL